MNQVIMDSPAVLNDELCVEKNELDIFINKKFCKVVNNTENYAGENDVLTLLKVIRANSITSLQLSNCQLLDFPLKFCSLDFITELNISGNKLEKLPDEFVNLKKLRFLDISNNLFYEFPHVFYSGLHLIQYLNVSNNKINFMCKLPCCITKLHHLDLSSNKLVEPPPWLLDDVPSCLTYVDLSNNPCFEHKIQNMNTCSKNKVADGIKVLKISCCRLRFICRNYLLNFSSLNVLDVGNHDASPYFYNYISSLHFPSLPLSIEKLSIVNTEINSLISITDLSNLRYLDISCNMISWLPVTITNLKSLTVLHARDCSLGTMPPEMNELVSLKELHLSSNQLSSSEGFEQLVNLQVIDLYANEFISLPNLHQFPKLKSLDLCQNYVEPPSVIEINGYKYDYVDLKANLRSKIKNCNRMDGEKEFTTPLEDEVDYEDELSDDDNGTSLEEEFCDAESENACVVRNENNFDPTEEEFWKTEEYEFDPNVWEKSYSMKEVFQIARKDSYENLTKAIPYQVKTHPHYFNPYQLVTSVINNTTLPRPVEGQFDD